MEVGGSRQWAVYSPASLKTLLMSFLVCSALSTLLHQAASSVVVASKGWLVGSWDKCDFYVLYFSGRTPRHDRRCTPYKSHFTYFWYFGHLFNLALFCYIFASAPGTYYLCHLYPFGVDLSCLVACPAFPPVPMGIPFASSLKRWNGTTWPIKLECNTKDLTIRGPGICAIRH